MTSNSCENTDIFAPHCGCHERVIFFGKITETEDFVCVCLEPGLYYGFHYGAAGSPLKASFSVEDRQVRGDFDWRQIDGVDWASLSVKNEGTTYTLWVSRPETAGDLPQGRLEITDGGDFKLVPASIIHELPFD